MPVIFRLIASIITLAPLPLLGGVYNQILTEDDYRLERWDIPILRLVITNVKPHPNDESLFYIEANLIEIIRKGRINSIEGSIVGQWQPYRRMPSNSHDLSAANENVVDSLIGADLICFTGSDSNNLYLYAYRCFAATSENRKKVAQFATTRPISSYLYKYSQATTLIFPLRNL